MSPSPCRPVIGISSYGRDDKRRFRLSVDYVDAIRRAGGSVLILPPGDPGQGGLFDLLDGIVMSGGGDVEPARYGGDGHPTVYGVDRERDESEVDLVYRIVRTGRPALCVCRGLQVLNVAMGGTLIPHLPDAVGDRILHRVPGEGEEKTASVPHDVSVEPGSLLGEVLGTDTATPASWHHQAIDRPAPGLRVVARAADGTIEAAEVPAHPWLIGVQWHPELTAADDPRQQRLFDGLVAAARLDSEGERQALA